MVIPVTLPTCIVTGEAAPEATDPESVVAFPASAYNEIAVVPSCVAEELPKRPLSTPNEPLPSAAT